MNSASLFMPNISAAIYTWSRRTALLRRKTIFYVHAYSFRYYGSNIDREQALKEA